MDKQNITPEQLEAHCEFAGSQARWLGSGLGGAIYLLGSGVIDKEAWIFTPVVLLLIVSAATLFFARLYHGKIVRVIRGSSNEDLVYLKEWLPNARWGDIFLDVGFLCLAAIGCLLVSEILKPDLPYILHDGFTNLLGLPSYVASFIVLTLFASPLIWFIVKVYKHNPPYDLEGRTLDL